MTAQHRSVGHIGVRRRMARLFRKDGFAVCVAGDYGLTALPAENVYRLREVLGEIIAEGPDGILLSPGQAAHLGDLFSSSSAPEVLLRCDWFNAPRLAIEEKPIAVERLKRTVICNPDEALRLNAIATVSWLFLGYDPALEAENLLDEARLVHDCHRIGMPCAIEPLAPQNQLSDVDFAEALEKGAGLARELGADFLKIPYSGDIASFRRVVKAADDIPVLVLGGRREDDYQDSLRMAADAKAAGARGVVFGRNVTLADDPGMMVRELVKIFHG